MASFRVLYQFSTAYENWELTALSALSIMFGLRAKEAIITYYGDANVVWTRAKGRTLPWTVPPLGVALNAQGTSRVPST